MMATIDEELLVQLRDKVAHAVVFATAAERSIREALELVDRIGHEEGESDA